MTKIRWEPVVIDTIGWFSSIRAFVEEIETVLPSAERKVSDTLEELAKKLDWDASDYWLEKDEIELKFKHWIPRSLAYSTITLIHAGVETQLIATANRLQEIHNYALKVNDLRGDSVDRAKTYITKVAGVAVGSDIGWPILQDLSKLRNIIVHRRGRQGSDHKHQQAVRRLTQRYSSEISLSDSDDKPDAEVRVSLSLCKRFIDEAERFFEGLFEALNWPNRVVIEQQSSM